MTTLATTGFNGDLGLGGFRSNAFPQAVVNPANGDVYVAYNDNPAGPDRSDVFMRISADDGATWSAPQRVNNDLTTRDNWQPTIAVRPDGSQIGVFWYDRRLDGNNNMIDWFGAVGNVSGINVTFPAGNTRVSTGSFLPVFGVDPIVVPPYMGDNDQAQADNKCFYTTWGDNRDASLGHAGKNANVRFAKLCKSPAAVLGDSQTAPPSNPNGPGNGPRSGGDGDGSLPASFDGADIAHLLVPAGPGGNCKLTIDNCQLRIEPASPAAAEPIGSARVDQLFAGGAQDAWGLTTVRSKQAGREPANRGWVDALGGDIAQWPDAFATLIKE